MIGSSPRHDRIRRAGMMLLGSVVIVAGCAEIPVHSIPEAARMRPEIVVFDVDGTLTPTITAIFTARQDAAAVARKYVENGYRIVYLTARIRLLQGAVPGFLNENGFPPGDLVVAKTEAEQTRPETFKAGVLNAYRARGWEIAAAYGDSATDFLAYTNAGIPKEKVFALRRSGEANCEPGAWKQCISAWAELLKEIPQ
jgi:hypothetical protein